MALTPPPVAPPPAPTAPGDAPSRANPSTFRSLADAFVVWQVGFRNSIASLVTWLTGYISWAGVHVAEMSALQADVQAQAGAAQAAAAAAETHAGESQFSTYAELRGYAGPAKSAYVTGYTVSGAPSGAAGLFARDDSDATSADNGGTIIVAGNGTRWKRIFAGPVCVDWFGADVRGVAGSANAIEAAWSASKVAGVVKRGIRGDGYRLERGIVLAGDDDLDASTDHGTIAVIDIANIAPDPGIGVAVTIHTLRRPKVLLSFSNGGNESTNDVGVQWYDVEDFDPHIRGSNYRGLLCKFDGTAGRWTEGGGGTIWARKCLKAFDFTGAPAHNTGTGRLASVWDVLPTLGSTVRFMDDITVDHWENTIIAPTFTASNAASISNCSSVHLGTVALGKDAGTLLVVNANSNVHIKEAYLFGGKVSGEGTATGLRHYENGLFTIGKLTASGCAVGAACEGNSNLEVGLFSGLNNGHDFTLQQGAGSNLTVNLTVGNYFSQGAYAESMTAAAGVSGELTIAGGRIRAGNLGAAALAGIDTSASSGSLLTRCSNLSIDASWATSVKTVDKAKFAGYGNNFQGATPIIDAGGRKGSLDGRSWLINVPALSFATNFQNANPYPVYVWIPLRFEATGIVGDFATLKLVDYEGNTLDLVDTRYLDAAAGIVIPFALKGVVPAGWSYRVDSSSAGVRVTFSGTPRSLRI